ncbi:stage II sporulation protein M [Clostridium perfringens]
MSDSILRDIKRSFLLINIIYILFFILGFFFSDYLKEIVNNGYIFNPQSVKINSNKHIFVDIFNNNIRVGIKISLGVITLGLSSIFFIILNGFFFGIVSSFAIKVYSLNYYLKLIIFHGFIEILTFNLLATAAIIPLIFIKNKIKNKRFKLSEYFKSYLFLIFLGLVLILICALIESFISTLML